MESQCISAPKICAICGESVSQDAIQCPKCGRGIFETQKSHWAKEALEVKESMLGFYPTNTSKSSPNIVQEEDEEYEEDDKGNLCEEKGCFNYTNYTCKSCGKYYCEKHLDDVGWCGDCFMTMAQQCGYV
jgi:hypothetical protein